MTTTGTELQPARASRAQLLRLAWPLIVGNSFWTLQAFVDRVLLSQYSTEAVGAGMSAVMMFWSCLTLFQYTVNYATTFVAQYTGAGQAHRVGAVVGQALWLALFCGVGLAAVMVPLAGPLVDLAGHNANLRHLEVIYFRCLCFSAVPFLVTAAVNSFFSGRGDSRTVLVLNVIGLAVNAGLAAVLIPGSERLGIDAMGVAGAGWATVVGTSTSAVLGLALLLRPRFVREFGNGVSWGLNRALMGRLLHFGLPQGVGACMETLAFFVFLIFIGRLGTADLAATSIAWTLNMLAFMPMMGIGQAVEVLVGQYLGADRPDGAERSAYHGLEVSFGFTLLVAAAYVLAPGWLAYPFQTRDDPAAWAEVVERVPLLLRFVAVYCLFDSLTQVFAFALRGAGDTRFVTLVSIAVAWPVMVVPTWASWYFGWGMYWAWGFASAYIILLALILLWRFRQGRWKQMRVIEQHGSARVQPAADAPQADARSAEVAPSRT